MHLVRPLPTFATMNLVELGAKTAADDSPMTSSILQSRRRQRSGSLRGDPQATATLLVLHEVPPMTALESYESGKDARGWKAGKAFRGSTVSHTSDHAMRGDHLTRKRALENTSGGAQAIESQMTGLDDNGGNSPGLINGMAVEVTDASLPEPGYADKLEEETPGSDYLSRVAVMSPIPPGSASDSSSEVPPTSPAAAPSFPSGGDGSPTPPDGNGGLVPPPDGSNSQPNIWDNSNKATASPKNASCSGFLCHPIGMSLVFGALLVVICLVLYQRRRKSDSDMNRGEYRQVAAQYMDSAFDADLSEEAEYFSDEEEEADDDWSGVGKRTIEMRSIDSKGDDNLALEELNG